MGLVDMHIHSHYSDGTDTPAALVKLASEAGLKAIALTDHDTVEGVAEALTAAAKLEIEIMPGVEISTDADPEMHILGYFLPEAYKRIENTLDTARRNRMVRNEKIIKKLNKLGFDISLDEVRVKTNGDIMGRVHIAEVLVDKGYSASIDDAFSKLLAQGRPAYAKREMLSPEYSIKMISDAGGIPVLAHPRFLEKTGEELEALIIELKTYGLMGIEAFYPGNTERETETYTELAKRQGLLITGGSDFHGIVREDVFIGTGDGNLKVDYKYFLKIKEALKQNK